ncbi:alpha-methylacyl-CoA racemase-like [Mercenaria mercenaria]|uniref:alpha-methylacyl-CoA racemase-like n=1 Tax=Mercenaria mercenaria TaxID=6596 RepID=UPI001E1DCF11|nr:alpha-methylacyl-CoA racemase-like [Mercenaria mercenaria]
MALKGVRVIEMAGLAPAPFCGMILSDFGASVTRIDRTPGKRQAIVHGLDTLSRGKRSVAVDLKQPEGINVVRKLCSKADVVIEPFRKGVMEKLGLGPEKLMADNPGLIYARLTGFGQKGPLAAKAGHDINYIAISGVLSQLGRKHENPYPPINLLADFAGGGLMCALGIAMALYERTNSGQGQLIDANMVNGSAYLSTFLWTSRDIPIWPGKRGENNLDGGAAFYGTYKTKDEKYVSIGPLEPQFYAALLKGLGLSEDEMPQHTDADIMEKRFAEIFLTKTREEWTKTFENLDACFAPILEMDEAQTHDHNIETEIFLTNNRGKTEPAPAPKLSRTPGVQTLEKRPKIGEHTQSVLIENGMSKTDVEKLLQAGIVFQNAQSSAKL